MDKPKQEEKVDLEEILLSVESINLTAEILASLKNENEFMVLAVELAKEGGSFISVVADIAPPNSTGWDRNHAILVGNLVRLAKLVSGQLDQVCQKRQETSFILSRLIFETIVNIKFFIKNASPELFDSYVQYSMRHEKKLRDLILSEVNARGGVELPIEKRMLYSIKELAKQSGISMDDMSSSEPKTWGGKNFYERAMDVGLDEVYLALYGGGSHSVHGNWMDLLGHHLRYEESVFIPKLTWSSPSPQILFSTTLLSLETIREYLIYIGTSEDSNIIKRINTLFNKVRMADCAHETFLISKY